MASELKCLLEVFEKARKLASAACLQADLERPPWGFLRGVRRPQRTSDLPQRRRQAALVIGRA